MKRYYLKERFNPQFEKPYYVKFGQLLKKDAKRHENTSYGDNYMLPYDTEKEYNEAIAKLEHDGFTVQE